MKLLLVLAVVAIAGGALVEARAIRDLKSTLITKGNDLVKKADEAIVKLEADKKTHEVTIIKTEEARLKKLIADLEAATDEAKIRTLEHELTMAENRLQHELARVNHTTPVVTPPKDPVTRDLKADLISQGNALVKKADEAIVKLEADKKTHEVTVIKAEEVHIKKLIADLEAATDEAKIRTLEHELRGLEARLAHELNRINHTTPVVNPPKEPVTRDLKSTLITRGNDLVKKADEAIVKLEADKKTHEVTVIKAEEAKIKTLVADLEAATDEAKIKTLEHELGALEARLAHELNRINHNGPIVTPPKTPVTRDLKSTLITRGNDLVKKADEAIVKLEADKKTHEVTVIKAEEAKIKTLVADLEAATDEAKIRTLEHELGALEARLAHELARVNHTTPVVNPPKEPVTRDVKSDLIAKGNALLKKADEAIVKLEADKKTHEVTIVKTEEAKIKKLISDLEAATDDAKVKTLEHELTVAENRLQHELTRVNHVPVPPAIPA